jgi:RNA polymerase sigma factor (sigma-70 family)
MIDKTELIKKHLTPRQYEVFSLKYHEGRKHWQIAEILGLERSTVTHTLKNIHKKIRKITSTIHF